MRTQRSLPAATVWVPATTANMGTGFDALGLALGLHNRCALRRVAGARIEWPGASAGACSMLREAAAFFFRRSGRKPFGFSFSIRGDVPAARGLGSSVTVRLGALAGLNRLTGSRFGRQDLLEMTAELEGHPDNAAPAVLGGFVASVREAGRVVCVRSEPDPRLRFILAIPDFEVSTSRARKVLPARYSRADAVHNLSRACLLTAALIRREHGALWTAVDDRIHQPYRARLIPFLKRALAAARKAGALAGWLSGSGSTLCLVADGSAPRVVRAVRRALPRRTACDFRVVKADNRGFRVS